MEEDMKTQFMPGQSITLTTRILSVITALTALLCTIQPSPASGSTSAGEAFGPACGMATIDGRVDTQEWQGASSETFQMITGSTADLLTATLYVMNSGSYLYLGITINDDEFSEQGKWLPGGDTFRIDFDNDHSGSLFALRDDVLGVSAGWPYFEDSHIVTVSSASSDADIKYGGRPNGDGASGRAGELNHFELMHPLCSGDELDFCLHPGDLVGFRLEYLDGEGPDVFNGSHFFPDREDTSIADIVIAPCSNISDNYVLLPFINR